VHYSFRLGQTNSDYIFIWCVHVLSGPLLGKVLIGVSQIEKGAVLSGPLLVKEMLV